MPGFNSEHANPIPIRYSPISHPFPHIDGDGVKLCEVKPDGKAEETVEGEAED